MQSLMPRPAGRRFAGQDRCRPLHDALVRHGQMGPGQTAGRFYPMACVAIEVTQRCNLDCTLCYLSDMAEQAHDPPLELLLERVEMVASHYGPGTSVQLSGGDPTLRRIEDLEALCRAIAGHKMHGCLMTNGIKATHTYLARLKAAGLRDVAFHVDMTQERKGYGSEVELNAIRRDYIERARGTGLRVLFNTTVFEGNLHELPEISRFFRDHAGDLTLVSFQLQAETGRGVLRKRPIVVDKDSVQAGLERGFEAPLETGVTRVGHEDCNRYANLLIAGNSAVAALPNQPWMSELILAMDRHAVRVEGYLDPLPTIWRVFRNRPIRAWPPIRDGLRMLWQLAPGWFRAPGRISRLAVLIHDFMDAENLDAARCQSCVFMNMTGQGPLSMCVHNAERDTHIFSPARLKRGDHHQFWHAASNRFTEEAVLQRPDLPEFKRLKGRWRHERQAVKRKANPKSKVN